MVIALTHGTQRQTAAWRTANRCKFLLCLLISRTTTITESSSVCQTCSLLVELQRQQSLMAAQTFLSSDATIRADAGKLIVTLKKTRETLFFSRRLLRKPIRAEQSSKQILFIRRVTSEMSSLSLMFHNLISQSWPTERIACEVMNENNSTLWRQRSLFRLSSN